MKNLASRMMLRTINFPSTALRMPACCEHKIHQLKYKSLIIINAQFANPNQSLKDIFPGDQAVQACAVQMVRNRPI